MREVLLISFGIAIGYYLRQLKAERDESESKNTGRARTTEKHETVVEG